MRGDGTREYYVDPSCVQTIAEGKTRDPAEEPIQQSEHAMHAWQHALQGVLAEMARTEAYLAELRRRAEGASG
jgi:hypothetical protein